MPSTLKTVTPFLKFAHLRILLIMKTTKKSFDAVKLMRELREQVNKEIANMTVIMLP